MYKSVKDRDYLRCRIWAISYIVASAVEANDFFCQKLRLNFNRNGLPNVNKELGFRRRVQISILQTTWQPG